MTYLGIDTGGTFTDFVLWYEGKIQVHKVLSTPDAPEKAILQGIADLKLNPKSLRVVHGSTVATNAVLEGKGVKTVFISNRGFADLLTIGRQNRRQLYNLRPSLQPPPVPAELCMETGGRLSAQGETIEPLSDADLESLRAQIALLQPESVAVNLLFSWLDGDAEQRIAGALPDGLFISLSSQILPEIREYERGIATWLNAWIGPLVQGYVERLQASLPGTAISVMQSSGDTIAACQAGGQAVRMLLSGPAGGLVAAGFVASHSRLLTFDMGGTSTDVALIDGQPKLTSEGHIAGYPVAVPMVDMHTIGAGGGSIAWLDAGGMLQVGPQSAGADPGPACYGGGGTQATVTDANLVLGRLRADAFLGGAMWLDESAAEQAMRTLADTMNCSMREAASGIIKLANEHMARALRTISVQRGIDPRGFMLISFGGAGGLHVCALAQALGLEQAMVPVHAGVLSALGMLAARPGRQLSRTWQIALESTTTQTIDKKLHILAQQGISELAEEGVSKDQCQLQPSLDCRYTGQSYTLNIPWQNLKQAEEAFHVQHQTRYGHRLTLPVELVNLRMSVTGPAHDLTLDTAKPITQHSMDKDAQGIKHYQRTELLSGQVIQGPAIISEQVATTWLENGWQCRLDKKGNLLLARISHQNDAPSLDL